MNIAEMKLEDALANPIQGIIWCVYKLIIVVLFNTRV